MYENCPYLGRKRVIDQLYFMESNLPQRLAKNIAIWFTHRTMYSSKYSWKYTGCPKKVTFKLIFEFLSWGGVFLGVKKNSKNFGNKKNIWLLNKILRKCTLFYSKSSNFIEFSLLLQFQNVKKNLKSQNIQYLHVYKHKHWLLWHYKKFLILNIAINL